MRVIFETNNMIERISETYGVKQLVNTLLLRGNNDGKCYTLKFPKATYSFWGNASYDKEEYKITYQIENNTLYIKDFEILDVNGGNSEQ